MGTRNYFFLGAFFGLVGLTAPTISQAQPWLSDRAKAEGSGVRVGNLELHPGVALEGGYDSNAFLEDDTSLGAVSVGATSLTVVEKPNSTATFRLSPHLVLSTLSKERLTDGDGSYTPPTLAFKGGLAGSLYVLAGVPSENSPFRYEGRLNMDETLFPERQFSLGFVQEGSVRRLPLQAEPGYQWHGGVGARTEFGSAGGVLRATLGYKFGIDRFTAGGSTQSARGFQLSDNNYHTHAMTELLTWKFLPKTSLFQDASLTFQNWASKEGAQVDRFDTARVAMRFGANGALSKELSTTLAVGYGSIFLAGSPQDADNVLAQAKIAWRPSAVFDASLGYGRELSAALLGNTSVTNVVNATADARIGGVATVGITGGLRFVDFAVDSKQRELLASLPGVASELTTQFGFAASPKRNDVVLDLDLHGEYRLSDWLAITAQVRYLANFTDYAFLLDTGTPDSLNGLNVVIASPAAYTDVTAFMGVRAFL